MIGQNIDMNAVVQTNAEENMAAANLQRSMGPTSGEASPARRGTTEVQATATATGDQAGNASAHASVKALNRDESSDVAVNEIQPDEPGAQPSNRTD